MINLLLLTCGTNASFHFSKIIKEFFPNKFKLIGTDINEKQLIPSMIYLDKFYKVSNSGSVGYFETILDICKKEKINFMLPSFDVDLLLFNKDSKELAKLNIEAFSITEKTAEIYKDKRTIAEFLKDKNYPLPKSYSLKEIEDTKEYFIKPKNGSGSTGARRMSGNKIKELKENGDLIIQEICNEPEYTVECFYYKGQLKTVTRERICTKSGVCTKALVFFSDEFHLLAERFTQILNCPLFFNLQFMTNRSNQLVLTDVNFRSAGGMSLSNAAGWDVVSAIAKTMLDCTDEEVFATVQTKITPQYVVRSYHDIVTSICKSKVAYDLDGTLLDSRQRHTVVMKKILNKKKIKIDISDFIEYKRNGKNNVDYLVSKGIDLETAKNIQSEWINLIEDEEFVNSDVLYDFALDILKKDKEKFDLILITARQNELLVQKQIKKLGLAPFFERIYVVNPNKDVSKQKAKILQDEGVILMSGDTINDKEACDIANIKFKHYNCGFHSKKFIYQEK